MPHRSVSRTVPAYVAYAALTFAACAPPKASSGASAASASSVAPPPTPSEDLARFVDPRIGTGGHGHTFPGPTVPFGMLQPGPDTRIDGWDGASGYHDSDTFVYGFAQTHLSGTGVADYGDVLLLPSQGATSAPPPPEAAGRPGSHFRKDREHAEAGYYRVHLDDSGVDVELTTSARVAWHRYTFAQAGDARVRLDLTYRDEVLDSSLHLVDDHTIEGMRRSRSWAQDQLVYFVVSFDHPFTVATALEAAGVAQPGSHEATGTSLVASLHFAVKAGEPIVAKVALSAVDPDGARKNLLAEPPGADFDATRRAARAAWNDALAAIVVEGGTREQRTTFYTALYHTLLVPNLYQDVDGRFRGLDRLVHTASGYTRYTVFSLWDTFRATHPLYTIIDPERAQDFVRTFLAMFSEAGRLPVWELAGNETDCMIGYHSVSVILDAWAKGLRGFDATLALRAMEASGDGERAGLPAYRAHGFLAVDEEPESVSKTLEYGYDDWCIGRFAQLTGHDADARRFLGRAQAWQHLLDPAGFMHARLDGQWLAPFDPAEVNFHYTEANAWQYSFFVPHDVDAWMARLGGAEALEGRLDALFAAPSETTGREQVDITGMHGQYAHGNEPSHHMAYLYAFAGAPARTAALVHELTTTLYHATPDGLVGNEDCGQMSAWLVFSALGFYPVTPGVPEYVLGTPLFDRATIRLPGGRHFVVSAHRAAPGAFYVQSATLGGVALARSVLTHDALVAGGELVFELGTSPSRWATAEADRPHTAVRASTLAPQVTPAPVAEGTLATAKQTTLTLIGAAPGDEIHYRLDGGDPDERSPRYTSPLVIKAPATLRFRAYAGGVASPIVDAPVRKLRVGRSIRLAHPPSPQYQASGGDSLLDGVRGGTDFRLGRWLGFLGVELDAVIDLGGKTTLHRLSAGFLHDQGSWIFLPDEVRYDVSDDGHTWRPAGVAKNDVDPHARGTQRREFPVTVGGARGVRARYLRVQTKSFLTIPAWHAGAGERAYFFVDEITAE